MPNNVHNSVTNILAKLASLSDSILVGALNMEMYFLYSTLMTVLAIWFGVMYTMAWWVKWYVTSMICTVFGCSFRAIVFSMDVKSTCNYLIGAVVMMDVMGALTGCLSYCWHCVQCHMAFLMSSLQEDHQNLSQMRDYVLSWPWCPASWWQSLRADVWWVWGTTNSHTPFSFLFRVTCK